MPAHVYQARLRAGRLPEMCFCPGCFRAAVYSHDEDGTPIPWDPDMADRPLINALLVERGLQPVFFGAASNLPHACPQRLTLKELLS